MSAELKFMEETDIGQVSALENAAFGRMAWPENDFRKACSNEYDYAYVIRDGETVLAYSVLRVVSDEAELEVICTAENARKRGLGDRLMKAMLDCAREKGCSVMFLEVRDGNAAAIALYEKNGFVQIYTRKNYYRFPTEDARIMRAELSDK